MRGALSLESITAQERRRARVIRVVVATNFKTLGRTPPGAWITLSTIGATTALLTRVKPTRSCETLSAQRDVPLFLAFVSGEIVNLGRGLPTWATFGGQPEISWRGTIVVGSGPPDGKV